ncbi:hypothetical protein [Xanthomonas campestris]|uniref:Uncharacterized protein n=1 Tax=Xanthomonas campestris pv. papavericola TaxID=487881 RepID=A0AAJ3CEQ6_XANCA|nr:hypothetical protein [Xanthomonas campestris]MEC3889609.1 hypothetical protein [Xanthomonas campestris pv. papavericola]
MPHRSSIRGFTAYLAMLGEQPSSSQAADQLIEALVQAVDVMEDIAQTDRGELTLVLHRMVLCAQTQAWWHGLMQKHSCRALKTTGGAPAEGRPAVV